MKAKTFLSIRNILKTYKKLYRQAERSFDVKRMIRINNQIIRIYEMYFGA